MVTYIFPAEKKLYRKLQNPLYGMCARREVLMRSERCLFFSELGNLSQNGSIFACTWSVHETEIFWHGKREETFARLFWTKAVPAKQNNLTCERPQWQNLIIKIMDWKWRRGHGRLRIKPLNKATSLFIFLQGLYSWTMSTNFILFNVHWEVFIFKGGIQRANHMIGVVFSSTPNGISPCQAFSLEFVCAGWVK